MMLLVAIILQKANRKSYGSLLHMLMSNLHDNPVSPKWVRHCQRSTSTPQQHDYVNTDGIQLQRSLYPGLKVRGLGGSATTSEISPPPLK
jgi:hypothetical protein